MEYLPLNIRVKGCKVVLIGGGAIAERKARLLLKSEADVFVYAPVVSTALQALLSQANAQWEEVGYQSTQLSGALLVVAATDDDVVNRQVAADAQAQQLLVNVVDQPAFCNVIFPAIIDRSPIIVAVSSGGSSPLLIRKIKARLETELPANLGHLADFLAGFRNKVKAKFAEFDQRKRFWENVVDGPVGEQVLSGHISQAQSHMETLLKDGVSDVGEVYLIGAGPGDPDLLTFKALRLMQKADVVLYDRLVAPAIVDLCRTDAQRIYVGKARDQHAVPQPEINQLLVDEALKGKRVVRLKGGDPFIFGRGGEEIEKIAAQGIPFQVVPGITAASGCASYAGIPLTHRDYAQSVRFITAHLKNNQVNLNWSDFQSTEETLVFYMGLVGLEQICQQLIAIGRSKQTPIALIQQGTTLNQKVICGELGTFPALVAQNDVKPPTLIIVGDVVKLHKDLNWFSAKD
ncbi:MAG: siroheme synthase CysG [Pseudomonadales bacterium]